MFLSHSFCFHRRCRSLFARCFFAAVAAGRKKSAEEQLSFFPFQRRFAQRSAVEKDQKASEITRERRERESPWGRGKGKNGKRDERKEGKRKGGKKRERKEEGKKERKKERKKKEKRKKERKKERLSLHLKTASSHSLSLLPSSLHMSLSLARSLMSWIILEIEAETKRCAFRERKKKN